MSVAGTLSIALGVLLLVLAGSVATGYWEAMGDETLQRSPLGAETTRWLVVGGIGGIGLIILATSVTGGRPDRRSRRY